MLCLCYGGAKDYCGFIPPSRLFHFSSTLRGVKFYYDNFGHVPLIIMLRYDILAGPVSLQPGCLWCLPLHCLQSDTCLGHSQHNSEHSTICKSRLMCPQASLNSIKMYDRKWWLIKIRELFVFSPIFLQQNSIGGIFLWPLFRHMKRVTSEKTACCLAPSVYSVRVRVAVQGGSPLK